MTETSDRRDAAHRGPPLVLLAGVHAVLFIASLAVLNGPTQGTWPLPDAEPDQIVAFLNDNTGLIRVVGMLQFGAAVPLVLYAASASSQLRHLGIRAAGTTIALAGGVVASTLLAVAALGMVSAAATAHVATPATATLAHQLVILAGGPGHVAFLGLLLAGIAVTSLLAGHLPAWLCWAMLAIAAAAELATLSLAVEPLGFLVAVGRFGGMAALVAAGVALPVTRRSREAAQH